MYRYGGECAFMECQTCGLGIKHISKHQTCGLGKPGIRKWPGLPDGLDGRQARALGWPVASGVTAGSAVWVTGLIYGHKIFAVEFSSSKFGITALRV